MSYLAHSLRGEELVLDSGTLWRAARAYEDAQTAQTPVPDFYAQLLEHPAMQALKDNDLLRAKLMEAAEAEQRVGIAFGTLDAVPWYGWRRKRQLRAEIAPLRAERDRMWREYEMLRKLSVRDGNRTLMLHRVHGLSEPAPAP